MSHSAEQMRKKASARAEAIHHHQHSAVDEMKAQQDVKDMYARQDREEYMEKQRESQENGGRNAPAVPKSMLDREYNKNADGSYTHKAKGG